ncbi:MAG: caspase family protein [Thermoguttaceae bacterium]|nr:caspase family protein [Thermoguttaceae bacterium]
MGGQGKTSKRNRILAAALGFAATAGAFVAFAQTEKARDWKHFRGKVVVTGTLDVGKTVEAFPSGASEPEIVWFRKSDGTAASYQYDLLSADDKKAVAVALDLDVNSEDDARSANDVNSRSMRPEAKCVRRAVLVGINDYARFSDLRFAGADVELMRSRLVELGFAPENIVVLTTQAGREDSRFAPNKTNIELELKRILEESGPDDMIFVMFTGHGFQTESYGGYAPYVGFAPSDAAPNRATVVDFASTVSLSKLFADLEACEARFKWVLVDACRENLAEDSPLAGGSAASKSLARSKALRKLEAPPGVAILQSCADGEFSWERAGHGIFTRTFVESLTELGDANEDGVVTFLEAAERTMTEVKRETSNRGEYDTTQTPYLSGSMTRFVLADVNTAKAKERWRAAVEAREKGDYTTARKEIDAALALMPNKPEYATEKRAIEAFAAAEEKAKAEAQAAADKARREAESAAQAELARVKREHAAALAAAEKAKSDAERKAKEEATARAEAERKAEEARRQA